MFVLHAVQLKKKIAWNDKGELGDDTTLLFATFMA